MKKLLFLLLVPLWLPAQRGTEGSSDTAGAASTRSFSAAGSFLDAAVNSLQSLGGLLKKEAYRSRVAALNNPASADLGFSLEKEVQAALRPLFAKARQTNTGKLAGVVSALMLAPGRAGASTGGGMPAPLLASVTGLVSSFAVQEKRVTREDLDTFLLAVSKYFDQYEKLNEVNRRLDRELLRLQGRWKELQFDLRAYLADLVLLLHRERSRSSLGELGLEELLLAGPGTPLTAAAGLQTPRFPSDGLKGARDIAAGLQKLFEDYRESFAANHRLVRQVLNESRSLGRSVNLPQVDQALRELDALFEDSRSADLLGLRLQTLLDRLDALARAEQ